MNKKSSLPSGNWTTYQWVIGHLRPYRGSMALIIICGLLASAGELLAPYLIQRLIDHVIPEQDKVGFYQIIGFLGGVFLLILLCSLTRNILQSRVSASAARDLQYNTLLHLRKLGFAYYEQRPVGETLSLMNHKVQSAEQIFKRFFPDIVQLTLFLTAAAVLLLYQSALLSLIIIPCFATYYLFGPKLDSKFSRLSRAMAESRTTFDKKVYESVSGAREFRAFGAEEWDIDRNRSLFKDVTRTTLSWVFIGHFRWSLRGFLFQIGTVCIFVLGYYLIQWNWMTVGQFIAFLLVYGIFMFRLSWLISQFIEQNMMLQEVSLLYELVHTLPLLEEPALPEKIGQIQGALTFDNVQFAYPGRPPVLNGISLDIRAGERIAIVGTSGNGKSTLLKLVDRFYDPTGGMIRLDGIPLPHISFDDLRGSIGYVFQDTYLFGNTVRENIRFGNPDASDEEVVAAAKAAYAHTFITELSDGYDTVVGERGMKLSGGQKQRIAIARMLIKNPRILLLDEATSALDNVSENAVRDALQQLLAGRTTIAVAHRLSTVMDYDRIVVLDGGVIAEQGSYNELMERRGLFYQLAAGEKQQGHGQSHDIPGGGEAVVLS
ncbi:ABC transporter ATP-binding protein/permease [Paenibacillus oenotherae]|uniref:ABC transporter ATP-binding protein/permease n=1 Tax=Paenibacillus oenotherae TaxID=1435645 RepID=A0ABS7D8T7_9BACL|nr:ABC transporter ATP-binding protein [Paenibacillus oenotherae]MBW7476354.1 ABC transporter ATP-binding protein/permease [Paenibacillus oenotherae]